MSDEKFEDFLSERGDIIDNTVYKMILNITGKTEDEIPWNMEIIGEVTDAIEETLHTLGIETCHPFFEGDTEIPCYKGKDCKNPNCPARNKKD